MRIAHVTSSLLHPLGGAEQYCLAVADEQRRAGHDVIVATGWVDDTVRQQLEALDLTLLVLPAKRPFSPDRRGSSRRDRLRFHLADLVDSARQTRASRRLQEGGFDVVHVHRFTGLGTSVLNLRGVPVVHTVHDFSLVHTSASLTSDQGPLVGRSTGQSLRRRVLQRSLGTGLTLVFPTGRTLERHREWGFEAPRSTVLVVPHGWPDRTGRVARTESDDPASPVSTFLFLGKLSEHKGVRLLLDAWGDGVAGARLRIGGDGALASEVAAAATRAPAPGSLGIEPLGWLDEVARTSALRDCDALLLPSSWPENFPIVVAESLLARRPVITTTVASPPLITDGESGLVTEPTAEGLRSALEKFAGDPDLRARLRTGAAERAADLDMDRHLETLQSLYGAARARLEQPPVTPSAAPRPRPPQLDL